MNVYIQSFGIGCGFGILNEILLKSIYNKFGEVVTFCLDNKTKCFINAFIVNVYGWGFLISSLLEPIIKKYNLFIQFLILAILVSIIESFVYDVFIKIWDGYSPLNHSYEGNFYPILDGKTSIVSIIYFSFILLFYNHYVIPKLKSINNKNA